MKISSFFWILPFISCIAGYSILYVRYAQQQIPVPPLIGSTVHNASLLLAENQLNLRLLAQKEDNDLPEGTIVNQTPQAGQLTRINQPVFCVVSKKSTLMQAPDFIGKSIYEIDQLAKKNSLRLSVYEVPSLQPSGACIGQIPAANTDLINRKLMVYITAPANKEFIFPDICGKKVSDLISFIDENNFKIEIVHNREKTFAHDCSKCTIREQRPLAGTIINQKNYLSVQLLVE
ncbi:PASTA domain-containing protein [Candidatus Dependentiae bacterium]|nr:PASTA domain-containing protein [Candidatus Dependentiae bacterium]